MSEKNFSQPFLAIHLPIHIHIGHFPQKLLSGLLLEIPFYSTFHVLTSTFHILTAFKLLFFVANIVDFTSFTFLQYF